MRTSGFQCSPPISRVNSPKRPSGKVQPVGQDFGLQHDLGVGDVGHVDGRARRQRHRLAADAAGDRHLVDAERRAIAGAGDLDRMGADGDRDRQRLVAGERALHEQPHIVRRDDVDAGQRLFLDDEAVDAGIEAELGIARDDDAGGDHRPAVVDRRHRDRQLVEIDVVADERHLARRRGFDVLAAGSAWRWRRRASARSRRSSRSRAPWWRARGCG